ncbi:MAG: phosphoribosylformylglycinamidine synthase subunit PurQ [Candidatus Thermoplasmatota archaeon]|nr:phosphoribosylformylglycinamidine synthase subunit PurQ [Candidatus Thermoplasmatota archaeon]
MKVSDIRVAVLRMEGINCEQETYDAFERLGARPEFVHIKQLEKRWPDSGGYRDLEEYDILMLPGGFSAGDYIRAGAIFASRIKSSVGKDLVRFIEEGKPVGGFCNGFQIMVELGVLPGYSSTMSDRPEAVLHANDSGNFECRPALLKMVNRGSCVWTSRIEKDEVRLIPVAHAEGNLILDDPDRAYARLFDSDMVVFRYCDTEGDFEAPYPYNPNGSRFNIAGICNDTGNVFGMMPHPERVFDRIAHPDWYRKRISRDEGDGRAVFESVLDHVVKRF